MHQVAARLRRYLVHSRNDFAVYWEKDAPALIAELKSADRVVGLIFFILIMKC